MRENADALAAQEAQAAIGQSTNRSKASASKTPLVISRPISG
jgi:hypothetical protein